MIHWFVTLWAFVCTLLAVVLRMRCYSNSQVNQEFMQRPKAE
jgi:hypothetical protein